VRGSSQPAGTVAWRYQLAGQGERAWHVFAPPHMAADAVQVYVAELLGPLATFERSTTQPEGAWNRQVESPATANSRRFDADCLPDLPLPFVWRAWQPWRIERPPDG